MPAKHHKRIIIITAILFLIMQTLIFGSIPMNTENEPINVVVKNGMSLYNIAGLLKDDNIIYSSNLFMLCSFLAGSKLIAGEYELKRNMSTFDIIMKMKQGERNIYTLKIIEGYNIYNVAETIQNAKITGRDEFIRLAKDKEFLGRLKITSDSLEGYLSPDTYYYSKETDVDKFLEKIVQRTFKFFERENIRDKMQELKMNINQTLTLASMIEKEAKMKDEKPIISAVFHNRLRKNMSLDCDPTVIYGTGAFFSPITKYDLVTPTPYNTYVLKGLPKGPICNPDKNSIMAALYPAPVDYLYFVSRNDGTHVFSKDMKTHNRFVTIYQRIKNTKKQ
ncbi:MAG: endolytic transglycosylase MltG [Proteobacteria bacterium]|nr:endolytic transglycosylase MltG [Pseudomonadota bacterium]